MKVKIIFVYRNALPSKSAAPTPTIMIDNGKVDAETIAWNQKKEMKADFVVFMYTPAKMQTNSFLWYDFF